MLRLIFQAAGPEKTLTRAENTAIPAILFPSPSPPVGPLSAVCMVASACEVAASAADIDLITIFLEPAIPCSAIGIGLTRCFVAVATADNEEAFGRPDRILCRHLTCRHRIDAMLALIRLARLARSYCWLGCSSRVHNPGAAYRLHRVHNTMYLFQLNKMMQFIVKRRP